MLKKILFAFIFLCVLGVSIYYFSYTHQSINHIPNSETISEVTFNNGNQTNTIEEAVYREVLKEFEDTRKTFSSSLNDSPIVEEYSTLVFLHEDGSTRTFYFYEKRNQLIVEVPYEGIYRVSKDSSVIRNNLLEMGDY